MLCECLLKQRSEFGGWSSWSRKTDLMNSVPRGPVLSSDGTTRASKLAPGHPRPQARRKEGTRGAQGRAAQVSSRLHAPRRHSKGAREQSRCPSQRPCEPVWTAGQGPCSRHVITLRVVDIFLTRWPGDKMRRDWQPWCPLGRAGTSVIECRRRPAPIQAVWTHFPAAFRDSSWPGHHVQLLTCSVDLEAF